MHIVQNFQLPHPPPPNTTQTMISLETVPATPFEPNSSPRISFSTEFLDEKNFISITSKSPVETEREKAHAAEFKFLSGSLESETMVTADELFFEGKLIPFWQTQSAEKLGKISLKGRDDDMEVAAAEVNKEERKVSWFVDDDPSPRPPKCTVLWKELLRLRKQRPSSLSPSSSSSSSSSSSFRDLPPIVEGKEGSGNREKHVKRIKKGLERTTSIRIRPMVNVPICTQGKRNALPPLFSLKKGKVLER